MVFLLIGVFAVVSLIEAPELIRNKHWREFIFFALFLLIAFILSLLIMFGVKLPNPNKGFEFIVKDLLHLNYK